MNWSVPLFRAFGIAVRVHWTLLIMLLWFLVRPAVKWTGDHANWHWALGGWGALFAIVLLHEYGHCVAARRLGGAARTILLWPLGGLAGVEHPFHPRAEFWVAAGGPLVNVALIPVLLLAALAQHAPVTPVFWTDDLELWAESYRTYYQLQPRGVFAAAIFTRGVYLTNLFLLAFNLLPLFPLDGGRMLRALLWAQGDLGRATWRATGLGMLCAGLLALYGVATFAAQRGGDPELGSFLVLAIAAFAFLNCVQERRRLRAGLLTPDDGARLGTYAWTGDAWKQGARDPDASGATGGWSSHAAGRSTGGQAASGTSARPGFFARRRREREARRRAARRAEAERLRLRIDELLAQVSARGLAGLSDAERRELARAGKRLKELSDGR